MFVSDVLGIVGLIWKKYWSEQWLYYGYVKSTSKINLGWGSVRGCVYNVYRSLKKASWRCITLASGSFRFCCI